MYLNPAHPRGTDCKIWKIIVCLKAVSFENFEFLFCKIWKISVCLKAGCNEEKNLNKRPFLLGSGGSMEVVGRKVDRS